MMKPFAPTLFVMLALLFVGCAASSEEVSPSESSPSREQVQQAEAGMPPQSVEAAADSVVHVLARADWQALARYVHPERGVRFSPYTYVDTTTDVRLSREELLRVVEDSTTFHWGQQQGSGQPIEGTLFEYYDDFIYDEDFVEARHGAPGEVIERGNTIVNISEVYDDTSSTFVSYHVPGEQSGSGHEMDWASLRLVFEREQDGWYLIGVVHDEWTI